MSDAAPHAPVRRRRLLYIAGYDARGPAHYHALYRDEAARQAAVAGHRLEVGPLDEGDPLVGRWRVQAEVEGQAVTLDVDYLRWEDLVRQHWPRGHARYLGAAFDIVGHGLRDGSLWRMLRTSRAFFTCCVAAAVVSAGIGLLALIGLGLAALAWDAGARAAALAGGAATLVAALLLSRRYERRGMLGWLTRGVAWCMRAGSGELGPLDERLDRFADQLLAALADDAADEVLLVGHCMGTVLATQVAARALARRPEALHDPRFALLTLAQVFPLASYPRRARGYRLDLVTVAQALGPRWVDVSASVDRCCTAWVDPTQAARGLDGVPAAIGPKRVAPRWHQSFTEAGYQALCRDLPGLHFQYLRANERPGQFDYFALSAGPRSLAARFAAWPDARPTRTLQCWGGPFPALDPP